MATKIGLQNLCRISTRVAFGSPFQKGFQIQNTGIRTLFTASAIGVDGYEKQRERTQLQFHGMVDKFRDKMREFTLSDTKNMIFSEDLKNMVHLVENRPEDLTLIHQMMIRFNQQNKNIRFGNFIFGPVIMRMYYVLNQPTHALEVFKDPELEGLFDQLATVQILCDLLYNNQMYQEVLDVYNMVRSKQVQGQRFPRNTTILAFAACFKLNTPESYDYVLKTLTEMKDTGVEPVRRVVSYAAALALKNNAPQVALEILTNVRTGNYVTIRNLKMLCLAALNRPDDCLPILRFSLDYDSPEGTKLNSVFPDVLEKIVEAVDKLGNKEVSLEFERIHKALLGTNQVSSQTLEEMMDSPIEQVQRTMGTDQNQFKRNNLERGFRLGQSIDTFRPQRNPMYQRQRNTITQE